MSTGSDTQLTEFVALLVARTVGAWCGQLQETPGQGLATDADRIFTDT